MSVSNEEVSTQYLAMVPNGWAKGSTVQGAIAGAVKNGSGGDDEYVDFKVWSLTGTPEALNACYVMDFGGLMMRADVDKEFECKGTVKVKDDWVGTQWFSPEQRAKHDSITRITIKILAHGHDE
mgnify:CR=1 FL=1|tara:strand:+ start:415 stop:786 length:372 start_codon:yes stop_codon:yes gene_type:complete